MKKIKIYTYMLVFLFASLSVKAQILTVEITNIRNNCGNIALAVFTNNKSFSEEKPYFETIYSKTDLKDSTMTITLKLKPGAYGISLLDDENKDGEMDYNWIGIPKEGFGFSNYYHKGIIKPSFNDFDFRIYKKDKVVHVKMKYF